MSCIIPFGMFMVFAMILAKIVKRAGVMGGLAKWAWGGSKPNSWSSTRGVGSARRRLGRYSEDLGKVLDPNPLMRELEDFMRERKLTGLELDESGEPILAEEPSPVEKRVDEPIEELFDEPIEELVGETIEEPIEELPPLEEEVEPTIVEELPPDPEPEVEPVDEPAVPPEPPPPTGPPAPAPRELAQTLFDSTAIGSDVQDRFERQFRGNRASWNGVIDRVERFTDDPDLGPGPGLRLELEVAPGEGDYGRAVRIVCGLPLAAEDELGDRGEPVSLAGTLVSCDPYLWKFTLAHGRLR